jgi:positive regulator of sigma E activity
MNCSGNVVQDGEIALVNVESGSCGKCHACGFGAVAERKEMEVKAFNKVGAHNGEKVELELSGKKVMQASAIIFLIPFAGFIIGFLIGYYPVWYLIHSSRPLIALLCGVVLLAASYFLVRALGSRSDFEFVITGFAPAAPRPATEASRSAMMDSGGNGDSSP